MVQHLLSLALGSASGLSATRATCWILTHIPQTVGLGSRGLWSSQTPRNSSQSRHLEIKREEGNLSGVSNTVRQANGNLDICRQVREAVAFSSGSCLPYKSQFANPSVLITAG